MGLLLRLLPITCMLMMLPQEIQSVIKNTGPAYHGCHFMTQQIFDKANNKWKDEQNMNIEMCIDHCDTNEQTLAILFNGSYCLCSETWYPNLEAPELNCKKLCPGNMGERCGGARALSIYAVCDALHYFKNCEYLCYCYKNMSCNFMTGECLNEKKCDFWHEGDRCDIKKKSNYIKLVMTIAKTLQNIWQAVKGYFVLEDKIPEHCEPGLYGITCDIKCHCSETVGCNRVTGVCEQAGCSRGWIGRRCDKPNSCDNSPCLNNGECVMDGMKITCKCVSPYGGLTCELIDPCSSTPCLNNGICTSRKNNYQCECTGDYYGERCDRDFRQSPSTFVYITCFREFTNNREFAKQLTSLSSKAMTPSMCSNRCRAKFYTYAGLQLGDQCWCSDSVGFYGAIPSHECSRTCSGDKSKICGDRDANSVYAVCPVGRYMVDCKGLCNCLYYPCDLKTGDCPEELCKVGFNGKHCDNPIYEPVGMYKQKKMYIVLALATYTAFVLIETVLFMLQHFRIIGRLPIPDLTPEGPKQPAPNKAKPTEKTTEKTEKPKKDKKKTNGTDDSSDSD